MKVKKSLINKDLKLREKIAKKEKELTELKKQLRVFEVGVSS